MDFIPYPTIDCVNEAGRLPVLLELNFLLCHTEVSEVASRCTGRNPCRHSWEAPARHMAGT